MKRIAMTALATLALAVVYATSASAQQRDPDDRHHAGVDSYAERKADSESQTRAREDKESAAQARDHQGGLDRQPAASSWYTRDERIELQVIADKQGPDPVVQAVNDVVAELVKDGALAVAIRAVEVSYGTGPAIAVAITVAVTRKVYERATEGGRAAAAPPKPEPPKPYKDPTDRDNGALNKR